MGLSLAIAVVDRDTTTGPGHDLTQRPTTTTTKDEVESPDQTGRPPTPTPRAEPSSHKLSDPESAAVDQG